MLFEWKKGDDGWLIWDSINAHLKPRFKMDNGILYKINPNKLHSTWRTKMEQVLEIWQPPDFEFIENGYKTRFIDGFDLHGNKVFVYNNDLEDCNFDPKYLPSIDSIFDTVERIRCKLGITFADISPSNIITDPNSDVAYMIDFDDIISPDGEQFKVWNYNTDKIFNKNLWLNKAK